MSENKSDGTERETVTVEREVLEELISTAKGKVESDVSRFGSDSTGYDLDDLVETIEAAEQALQSATKRSIKRSDSER